MNIYDDNSKFGEYFIDDSGPFDVILNICEDKIDIYIQICFEDYDSLLLSYHKSIQKYSIQKYLLSFNYKYDLDYDYGYGAPYVDVNIGFFDITDYSNVISLVECLCAYKEVSNEWSEEFPEDVLSEELDNVIELRTNILNKILEHMGKPGLESAAKSFKDSKFEIGILDEQIDLLKNAKPCSMYISDKCFFAKNSKKTYLSNQSIIRKWIDGALEVSQDEYVYTCYVEDEKRILLLLEELYIKVPIIIQDENLELIKEKNRLTGLLKQLCEIMPQELYNSSYDFMSLSADDFEGLCFEYLHRAGFINIVRRGKINAPDGEIDIEADYITNRIEKEHWIFQCKRTVKQIPSSDVYDIRYLAQRFSACGYGLFYANYFTPRTVDKLRNIEINDNVSILMLDKNNLETFLYYNPEVAIKYFGLK
jgi:hypothetical protein